MKKSMQVILIIAVVLALLPAGSTQARIALPAGRPADSAAGQGATIYLPLVENRLTPPDSIALIDQAVASGQISAEQGLIYKVFATWGDSRLPGQFKGSVQENAGDQAMREVAENSASLSESARVTLSPFFQPPTAADSWWQMQNSSASNRSAAEDSWQSLSAAGGKIKVWYYTGEADSARQAGVVQAALDGKIWSGEKTLMDRDPLYGTGDFTVTNIYLWHSYAKSDGTVIPFNGTRGATLAPECRETYSWIYINNLRPDGDETHPGIIQTVAHELFHAFQNSYKLASCLPYDWLAEATAKWVEDYIYPKANSEWSYAPGYLQRASVRLDDRTDVHHYGAYLLPYFLTHQFNDSTIVRTMWQNSEKYANSYLALKNAVPVDFQDSFWGAFLLTLWNQAPFPTFYKAEDGFTQFVKPEWATPVQVTTPGHEFVKEMAGDLPTGGVRYYHFTFPDSSVHSLSILNGLTFKLRQDSIWNSQYSSESTDEADQTFASDALPDEEQGVVMFAMYLAAGSLGWEFLPITADSAPICMDTQGRIQDLIVVLSNADFEHPDRVLQPQGLNTRLYASDMPCSGYQGTASFAYNNDGVIRTYSATNVVYQGLSFSQASDLMFPYIQFFMQGATVNYTISGTDSIGCTYSGNETFVVHAHPGAGSDSILLYPGILPGSPSYRGYQGGGSADEGTQVTYTVTCPQGTSTETDYPSTFFFVPIYDNRTGIKIGADGSLKGTYTYHETGGDWEKYEWDLAPTP